jgi:hypothetical protein
MSKQVFIYFLLSVLCIHAYSQNFLSWQLNDRYFMAQAGAGFASYRGELKHNGSIQNEISNLSLGIEARLLPKIGIRAELGRYSLRGNDRHAIDSSFAQQRNLSFSSVNYEASIQGIFFLKKYAKNYTKRAKCDPYLLAGIGGTYFSPQAELAGQKYNLYELSTEDKDYSRFALIIPVGAGLKWKINPFVNLATEITYRFTFTDYLDDVSGNYPASYPDITTELLSNRKDEIPVVNQAAYDLLTNGNPRGDSSNKDAYLFLNFKVEFYLPPGLFSKKKS